MQSLNVGPPPLIELKFEIDLLPNFKFFKLFFFIIVSFNNINLLYYISFSVSALLIAIKLNIHFTDKHTSITPNKRNILQYCKFYTQKYTLLDTIY